MAVYRYQAVSVGMWRGKIKRWNTTFHTTSSTATPTIRTMLQKLGYPNPGDVVGDCSGGLASIAVYSALGGAPISRTTYFDWQTPSSWIPWGGDVWASLATPPPVDASGESALVIIGNMNGLSASGKPVTTRKYFHAIPSRTATDYADPDIDATVKAAIQSAVSVSYWANPAGVAPGSLTVDDWYGNHQRVRGRRRPVTQVAAQSFSAGVLAGAATTGGGGGTAPQFQ